MTKRKTARRKRRAPRLRARTANKHDLYERAVQNAEWEIDTLDAFYRKIRGGRPAALLEDFCGTALLSAEWVRRGKTRRATGVDLHGPTIDAATKRNAGPLGAATKRLTLVHGNVLEPVRGRFDIAAALNFSYWVFHERKTMLEYFRRTRLRLKKDGLFILDTYGGWKAWEQLEDRRRVTGGFTYVWEQESVNPIDHSVVNHIHFEFRRGPALKRAFTYRWRLWTLRELTELLEEAGFREWRVYWEKGDEKTGKGLGHYRARRVVENEPGWVAYLIAMR